MAIDLYKNKNECCGCTACMNICPKHAIKMEEDEEGFLYPKIDEKLCVECGLCKKICAFQNGYNIDNRLEKIDVYATKNKSDEVRMHSSSGGMFYEMAKYVLDRNGVVYGVIFDDRFHAKHTRANNIDDVKKMMGSKYSQSDLGKTYSEVKEDLQKGNLVLFTGTPCQVAGLNNFLQNIDKSNLILVDIICHGTPSPKLFQEHIKFLEKSKGKKVIWYYHRTKKNGWAHTEEAIYEGNHNDYKSRLSQTWKRIFYTDLALRPTCYNCKYTNTSRPSDITIGDFWGIEQYDSKFADNKGISLVILNTKRGKEIFESISNNLIIKKKDIDEAVDKNPQLKEPRRIISNQRKKFWNDYKIKGFKYIANKYGGYNNIGKLKNLAKRMLRKI